MATTTGTVHLDPFDPIDGQELQPHQARVQDFLLGGKDHYANDRQTAGALCAVAPGLAGTVRAGRRFMIRAARHLATDHALDQFLDVGSGLPFAPDLHDVVQAVHPRARVVYVDDDPTVVAHARALLTQSGSGVVECLEGDLRTPGPLLASRGVQEVLDAGRPVAVFLLSVLHVIEDDDEAAAVVAELLAPWPPGSAVAICTAWSQGAPLQASAMARLSRRHGLPVRVRTLDEIRALFGPADLLDPGVVPVHRWLPGGADRRLRDHELLLAGGVAITR